MATLPGLNKGVTKDPTPPATDTVVSPITIPNGTILVTTKTTNETIDNVDQLIDYVSGDNSPNFIPQSAIVNGGEVLTWSANHDTNSNKLIVSGTGLIQFADANTTISQVGLGLQIDVAVGGQFSFIIDSSPKFTVTGTTTDIHGNILDLNTGLIQFDDANTTISQGAANLISDVVAGGQFLYKINSVTTFTVKEGVTQIHGNDLHLQGGHIQFDNVSTLIDHVALDLKYFVVIGGTHQLLINDQVEFTVSDAFTDNHSKKISNVVDPILAQDVVTKAFAEANFLGLTTVLDDLSDVVITAVADNDLLEFDTTGSKWKNRQGVFTGITGLGDQTQILNMNGNDLDNVGDISMQKTGVPILELYNDTNNPGNNVISASINFHSEDDNGTKLSIASIDAITEDDSIANPSGGLKFRLLKTGATDQLWMAFNANDGDDIDILKPVNMNGNNLIGVNAFQLTLTGTEPSISQNYLGVDGSGNVVINVGANDNFEVNTNGTLRMRLDQNNLELLGGSGLVISAAGIKLDNNQSIFWVSESQEIEGNTGGLEYKVSETGDTHEWFIVGASEMLLDNTNGLDLKGNNLINLDQIRFAGTNSTPDASDIAIWANSNSLRMNMPTNESLRIGVNGVEEYEFSNVLFTIGDANNISIGTTTGTKIATSTTQKLGFWNATPIVQPAHIADPAGGATVDAEARTAINSILAQLASLGLQASA